MRGRKRAKRAGLSLNPTLLLTRRWALKVGSKRINLPHSRQQQFPLRDATCSTHHQGPAGVQTDGRTGGSTGEDSSPVVPLTCNQYSSYHTSWTLGMFAFPTPGIQSNCSSCFWGIRQGNNHCQAVNMKHVIPQSRLE